MSARPRSLRFFFFLIKMLCTKGLSCSCSEMRKIREEEGTGNGGKERERGGKKKERIGRKRSKRGREGEKGLSTLSAMR